MVGESTFSLKVQPLPLEKSPDLGVSMMVQATSMLKFAYEMYEKAKDPPDPNFTELVVAYSLDLTLSPEVQEDRLAQLVIDRTLNASAFERAATTSVYRHDGALEAGDVFWQAEQILAASNFSSQGVFSYTDLIGMLTVQGELTSSIGRDLA